MGIEQLEELINERDIEGIRKLGRLKVPDEDMREDWAEQLLERAKADDLSAAVSIVMLDTAVTLDRDCGAEALQVLSERCSACASAAREKAGKTDGPVPKTTWRMELMQYQTQLMRAARLWL